MDHRTWKQPLEKRVFTYDFSSLLGDQTIAQILSVDSAARTGVTTLTNVAQVATDLVAQVTWGGGDDGVTYRTTVRVKDTANQEHELEGEIVVFDRTFTLPTGIATAYLDGEGYVDRFGYEETVRITDEGRKDVIDGAALSAALKDAQEFADGYLGTRYGLPIPTPAPALLQGIIADLARERLHKTRPTPQVTANADRARSLLKDLSAGRAVLALATGDLVEETAVANDAPVWGYGYDAAVFNADKLDRF